MSKQEPLIVRAARGETVERFPVWFMRQAGSHFPEHRKLYEKHGVRGITTDPELNSRVSLLPVDKLNVDGAVMYADIILPLEDMGISFHYGEGETGPVIHDPIESPEDVDNLRELDPKRGVPYILESISRVRESLDPQVGLIGFSGGPFTLAAYMIEGGASRTFPKTKQFMHTNPEAFEKLMNLLSRSISQYLQAQVESGIDLIQLFDSWIGVLSPADYRRWVLPVQDQIFRNVSQLNCPRILFGTDISGFLRDYLSVEAEVHSVDWRVDFEQFKVDHGTDYVLQGNLDPALLFAPEDVLKKNVEKMLDQAEDYRAFIANLGHRIPLDIEVSQLRVMVETVKKHSL